MNLSDALVPYTVIPDKTLRLRSKLAILCTLDLCKGESEQVIFGKRRRDSFRKADGTLTSGFTGYTGRYYRSTHPEGVTPYQKRKHADIRHDLIRVGIAIEDGDTNLKLMQITPEERIILPTRYDYSQLTLTELKTLIALHARIRYHRRGDYFRETCTQDQLAETANLSSRKLRDALRRLEVKLLISTKKSRKPGKEGTQFTLLDPSGSGATIFDIAEFYRERFDALPPYDRYAYCLGIYDTQGLLEESSPRRGGSASGVMTMCPFCKTDKSLRFTATLEEDFWKCFACKRGGDSARMWALRKWKLGINSDFAATMATLRNAIGDRKTETESREYPFQAVESEPEALTGMEGVEQC
jgi:hypothetical protein